MSKLTKAPKRPSISMAKGSKLQHAERMLDAMAGSATSWARHLIQFDMEDRSTYSPHTLPIAEMMRATARARFRGRAARIHGPHPFPGLPLPTLL